MSEYYASLVFMAVVAGLLILAIRSALPRKNEKQPPNQAESQGVKIIDLQPFDARTSKPVAPGPALRGPAYVVDGDTVVVRKTQIRLFGIDAPEMDHPYGKQAKWALVSLCRGQSVTVEFVAQDSYGRTVGRCYLQDGRDLSAEMVKLGMAIDWPKYSGGRYRCFETVDARKKLWLAAARQKGHMYVWERYEASRVIRTTKE